MNRTVKSLITLITGWTFIFIGILGLFLPFLQGILFILLGLYILSFESPAAKRLLTFIRRKFPKLHKKFEHAKKKVKSIMKRIKE